DVCSSDLLELIVSVHFRPEVGKALAGFYKLAQRLDLLDDPVRLKVFDILESKLDPHFAAVILQLIVDRISKTRSHAGEDLIEIIRVNFDELSTLESRERLFRLSDEIAEYTDDERQFLELDRSADLYIVRDLHTRRANPVDLVLQTFLLRHC